MNVQAIIEFCVNNLEVGSRRAMEKWENDPTVDVVEYGCLGHCGECFMMPFALVNGELVAGENEDELIKKIEEKIREIEDEEL